MKCQEIDELISAYIDGEVTPEETASLEEHIFSCPHCSEVLEELRAMKGMLGEIPSFEPPPDLHGLIMQNIESHRAAPQVGGFLSRIRGLRYASATVAAMLIFAIMASVGGTYWAMRGLGAKSEGLTDEYRASEQNGPMMKSAGEASPMSFREDASQQAYGEESYDLQITGADRKVVKDGQVRIIVSRGEVRDVSQKAEQVVSSLQGFVESSSLTRFERGSDEYMSYFMAARVPKNMLERAMEEMSDLGKVMRNDVSSENVTDQYIDLSARAKTKETQEQRLLQIMGEAHSVGELLQVEGELTRVRSEIESLTGRIQYYDKVTSMSAVSLWVDEEGFATRSWSPWDDVSDTFVNAWRNLAVFGARVFPGALTLFLAVVVSVKYYGKVTNKV